MQALKAAEKGDLKEWPDLFFGEGKRTGYIAVAFQNFQKTYFYGANDVGSLRKATKGKKQQYISVNAFDVDWNAKEFTRQGNDIKQIRNVAIDIDQYNMGLTIEEALDEIQALILSKRIPEPNLVLTSRGIQLFYSIKGGASRKLGWWTSYITNQLISKLKHVGADNIANSTSQLMRVPESVNERNNAVVTPHIWNNESYTLQELQAYCRPLEKFETRKRTKGKVIHLPIDRNLSFFYQTNHARLSDLSKLIDLRGGDFTSCRNILLYMYSYHQSLILNTQKEVLESMQTLFSKVHSRKDKEMSAREFEGTVKSAYKDAREFFEYYKDNGYKITYKHEDGIKKPYKTDNVIKLLNISKKEQMNMRTLRSKEIARKQHANYMRNKRRTDGISNQSMEEYNEERKSKQETLAGYAITLRKQGKKLHEIAKLLDISKGYVSKLIKKFPDV